MRVKLAMLGVVVVALFFSACGTSQSGSIGETPTLAPTATVAPTATPSPTPLPTVTGDQLKLACGNVAASRDDDTSIVKLGDLYIFVSLTTLAYPSRKLPDGIPLKPFKLAATYGGPQLDAQIPAKPLVNPSMAFFVEVCNASATNSHVIDGAGAHIDSFAPYTGELNAWGPCDGYYLANGYAPGGCGGGYQGQEDLTVTFAPNDGAGATQAATFDQAGSDMLPLPLTLKPHASVNMVVQVMAPTVAGYYLFAFDVVADGTASPFLPLADQLLLDQQAREWTGTACKTSAMKAQIPSSDKGAYICPGAS